MNDLIARLEKAIGPDRQLDLAIHTAIFGQPSEDDLDELLAPEAYTGSVDSALTLVPEGSFELGFTHTWWASIGQDPPCTGASAALAICIAAMKVRKPQ